jgi:hypothetical protein
MHAWFGCVLVAVPALLLSGCTSVTRMVGSTGFSLPYSYQLAPAASGTVIDGRTGLPISGAGIRTTTLQNYHESLGSSDADGHFKIGAIRLNPLNHLKTVGAEVGPWTWIIQVSAAGYRPFTQQLVTANDVESWEFGEMRLEPE